MSTLSVPFRFTLNGSAAQHIDGSDSYYAHILSSVLQTEPGELALDASFGTEDPTFERINRASIIEVAAKYVPEIQITNISTIIDDNGNEQVVISFQV
jgi:hypothetical protein